MGCAASSSSDVQTILLTHCWLQGVDHLLVSLLLLLALQGRWRSATAVLALAAHLSPYYLVEPSAYSLKNRISGHGNWAADEPCACLTSGSSTPCFSHSTDQPSTAVCPQGCRICWHLARRTAALLAGAGWQLDFFERCLQFRFGCSRPDSQHRLVVSRPLPLPCHPPCLPPSWLVRARARFILLACPTGA